MASPSSNGIIPGLLLAGATAALLAWLEPALGRAVAANLLTLIAAIYVGFGLATADWRQVALQGAGAAGFTAMAVLGLWLSVWWLVAGLLLHGFWDLGHHRGGVPGAQTPKGYPLFCAVYDWALAAGLLWVFGLVV